MRSFIAHPFEQHIYVSQNVEAVVARYNAHPACKKKLRGTSVRATDGMAMYFPEKGEAEPLFMMYLAEDWDESTLFHESLHLTHDVMHHCGVPINRDSTETQAYLMEYIAAMAQQKLK